MKRRQMGKVKRPETVNAARKIGRMDAIKKRQVTFGRPLPPPKCANLYWLLRDMVAGSKRRKEKPLKVKSSPTDAGREGGSDGP